MRQRTGKTVINEGDAMKPSCKMKKTKNNKKEDGKFPNKHINHDPQAESSRAVFGEENNERHS